MLKSVIKDIGVPVDLLNEYSAKIGRVAATIPPTNAGIYKPLTLIEIR